MELIDFMPESLKFIIGENYENGTNLPSMNNDLIKISRAITLDKLISNTIDSILISR